jgi:acetyl-CoA carboxylase biotin carboxylase subunit
MFTSVLVANRGEIACRIMGTLRTLGVRSVGVHADDDRDARHVRLADDSVALGPGRASETYLDADKIVAAALASGAQAVHPGYGFLSEDADFARRVEAAGLVFVGPDAASIEVMGDKVRARVAMEAAGVPVARGTVEPLYDVEDAVAAAPAVGYPLMVKVARGGGGIGMSVAYDADGLRAAFARATRRGAADFGVPSILLEQFVSPARHVEVQVFGTTDGVVALGERDCSVQRRHQKLAEETPSPAIGAATRARLLAASVRAAGAVDYRGAGTVEWLYDAVADTFTFLEMNTRLQVEHTVTELVTDLDLVAEQLRLAAGDPLGFDPAAPPVSRGHAIELRVCAEDPVRFLPGAGPITRWEEPSGDGVRVDSGYEAGDVVPTTYDSLLAKLCVWGSDRAEALDRARAAVATFAVEGPRQNLAFFAALLDDPAFVSGNYDTGLVARMQATTAQGAPT